MLLLVTGMILFFGAHSVSLVIPEWRARAIDRIGRHPWRALYSVVSLAGITCLVLGYGLARQDPRSIYVPPIELRQLAIWLMLPVFPLLAAAYLPGRIQRAAKHPMLLGIKIWSLAHLLANGMLADLLLFGAFLIWAGMVRLSLQQRSPNLNLAAADRTWNDALAVMLGLAVYAAFVLGLHERLFGIPVLLGG